MKNFLLTTLGICFYITLNAQINITSGLKARYDFTGDATDASGNNFNGVVNGATLTSDRFGNANSAYHFDGTTQNISVANFDSLVQGDEISLSVWVKADALKSQAVFLMFPDDHYDRLFAGPYYSHNGLSSTFFDYGDLYGDGRLAELGTYYQPLWEHYVFIASASQNMMQVYRNGNLQIAKTGYTPLVNRARELSIGGNWGDFGATNFFFNGDLDEIAIYDRALNPAEIMALNYGYCYNNVNDLRIYLINSPNPRPGFLSSLNLVYQNVGTNTLSGYVELNYDSNYVFLQSTPNQDSTGNHYLGWYLNNLLPGAQGTISIVDSLPVTVPLSTGLYSYASINPVLGDTTPADNYDTLEQTAIGSYDPNDIAVSPSGDVTPSFVSGNEYLYYTIRFQNTGTADAINVRLENDLDPNLFIPSVEIIGASHSYTYSLGTDNKLTFNFNNIYLPDSGTNQIGSNGFIMYKIKALPWLQVGDQISNTASIFFDFNLPVVTNTVITTVANPLSVSDNLIYPKSDLNIYPNPSSSDKVILRFNSIEEKNATVSVYDIAGKTLIHKIVKTVKGNNIKELAISDLTSGIYTILVNDGVNTFRSKLIKD